MASPRPYSDHYEKYKQSQAKSSAKTISPERAKQNATSAATGLVSEPKDFDWVRKNIPCQFACPARTDVPAYLDAVARGDFDAAYRVNLRDNVFPAVLGRVCTRPCEPACRHGWKGLGEPVAICFSKRSAADFLAKKDPVALDPWFPATGRKVAVVGAGAAGLAAARDLALMGHAVTVYEKHTRPGGLMLLGIPHFRLPRELVEREIEQIRRCGVIIRCGVTVGRDVTVASLLGSHDAVVVAAGTAKPNLPDLPGRDLPGVRHGLDFLFEANEGAAAPVGKCVVVIGGGFTAVDCARTARRLGAEQVSMVYRRSRDEMYITPGEVEEMLHEGIAFETNRSPVKIVEANGRAAGVIFVRTRMGEPDASGRRRFEEIAGSETTFAADTVLLATGQAPADDWLSAAERDDRRVFLCGDFATGAKSLIDAVAHGRGIARRIDVFLMNRERFADAVLIEKAEDTGRTRAMNELPRQPMPALPEAQRSLRAEVETGFVLEAAKTEASRCYLCHFKFEIDNDLCIYCDRCLKVKPVDRCIVRVSSLLHDGDGRISGYVESKGAKDYNMLYIDQNQCTRCGACKEVCPVECIALHKVSSVVQPRESST